MLKKINFVKMHGLGNDLVIINQLDLPQNCNLQQLAVQISDRHIGIGCDQLIIYNKQHNDYVIIIYNHNGSDAKLCGNALRCLAQLIYLNSGQRFVNVTIDERGYLCEIVGQNEISVHVGPVSFNESWMPLPEDIWPIAERYLIDLKEVICVDVGNPHLVIFSNFSDQDKEIIGKKLQEKDLFIDGVNVNFVTIKDNRIYLSVWERGAGLTLACGSGACASFAVAAQFGFVRSPCEVVFKLGSLTMSKHNENIIMTGPATVVALGEFHYV